MVRFFLGVSLFALVLGCSDSKPPRVAATLEAQVVGGANPDEYAVKLTWKGVTATGWVVRRKLGGDTPEILDLALLSGGESSLVDNQVVAGKEYVYLLAEGNEEKFEVAARAVAAVPRDYEVIGDKRSLPTDTRPGRVFLRSVIQTQGEPIQWDLNEIVSEGGTIDLSPVGDAAPGAAGKSCGDISIRAKRASGELKIVCKAQGGGSGIDGKMGNDGGPGKKGSPADVSVHPDKQAIAAGVDRLKAVYYGAGRNGTLSTGAVTDEKAWKFWFYCSTPAGDGTAGDEGGPGMDGGAGGLGGSTGKISIQAETAAPFDVVVDSQPGLGGLGGRGGNGGKGGLGGPPGDLDPSGGWICAPAKQGPTGRDGRVGRPGKAGQDGQVHEACLALGQQKKGDCP